MFTQLSLKVSIVVYTVKIEKILPWLLTYALTEDEESATPCKSSDWGCAFDVVQEILFM